MCLPHNHLLLIFFLSRMSSCHFFPLFVTHFILPFDILRHSWLLIFMILCPACTPPKVIFSLPLVWETSIAYICLQFQPIWFQNFSTTCLPPKRVASDHFLSLFILFLLSWPPFLFSQPTNPWNTTQLGTALSLG